MAAGPPGGLDAQGRKNLSISWIVSHAVILWPKKNDINNNNSTQHLTTRSKHLCALVH